MNKILRYTQDDTSTLQLGAFVNAYDPEPRRMRSNGASFSQVGIIDE